MTANQQRVGQPDNEGADSASQQGKSDLSWPRLRPDVDCVRTRDNNNMVNTVIDPQSGEAYEFGEEEDFLLRRLDGETGPVVTMEQFRERFDLEITLEQLNDFIGMLRDWNLLDEPGATGAAAASDSNLPAVAEPIVEKGVEREVDQGFERGAGQGAELPPGAARRRRGRGPRGGRRGQGRARHQAHEASFDDILEEDLAELENDPALEDLELSGQFIGAGDANPEDFGDADDSARAAGRADGGIWKWFNPDGLFAGLANALRPFRFVAWLVPLIAVMGIAGLFNNVNAFVDDFDRFRAPLSLLQNLIFSMITINLLVQFMSGIVARGLGLAVPAFGIRMVFGLIPRFAIETGSAERLERSGQYWYYGGPLLVRAALFGLAVALWIASRGTGTGLPVFCLLLVVASIISFVLSLNPLHKGNGYGLVKTMVGIPDLRRKAFAALFGKARGDRMENRRALQAFALASLIYLVFVVGLILVFVARWLELNYQGTGVVIFLSLLAFLTWRFRKRFRQRSAERQQQRGQGGRMPRGRRGRPREGQLVPRQGHGQGHGQGQRAMGRPMRQRMQPPEPEPPRRPWLKYVFLIILGVVCALPYSYETGGQVEILPISRQELSAETAGVIAEVAVQGGESLAEGTYLARMASSEQERDVGTTQAAILEQQAKLEELLNLPRPEDVALATKRLETAQTKARFSSESAARMEKLYGTGTISLDAYDTARRAMEVDKAEVVEAQANLERVLGGAHPQEIEAARYELQRLEEQLKFHDQELEDTRFVMPFDGTVVTMNLGQKVGEYLNKGEVFAVVESDRQVRVDLKIPESDISEVSIGSKTRVKIKAYPNREFTGEVVDISPVVEADTFGRVVTVSTVINNEERLLKTGMTGFGKIEGGTKPVIVAFTRMLVRFFSIEMWSWIP